MLTSWRRVMFIVFPHDSVKLTGVLIPIIKKRTVFSIFIESELPTARHNLRHFPRVSAWNFQKYSIAELNHKLNNVFYYYIKKKSVLLGRVVEFNVGLVLLSWLLPTLWDSSLRIIERHASTNLIHQGGDIVFWKLSKWTSLDFSFFTCRYYHHLVLIYANGDLKHLDKNEDHILIS